MARNAEAVFSRDVDIEPDAPQAPRAVDVIDVEATEAIASTTTPDADARAMADGARRNGSTRRGSGLKRRLATWPSLKIGRYSATTRPHDDDRAEDTP